jgi:hypothetical protein
MKKTEKTRMLTANIAAFENPDAGLQRGEPCGNALERWEEGHKAMCVAWAFLIVALGRVRVACDSEDELALYRAVDIADGLLVWSGVLFEYTGNVAPEEFDGESTPGTLRYAMARAQFGAEGFSGAYSDLHGRVVAELRRWVEGDVPAMVRRSPACRYAYEKLVRSIRATWVAHRAVCGAAIAKQNGEPLESLAGTSPDDIVTRYLQPLAGALA